MGGLTGAVAVLSVLTVVLAILYLVQRRKITLLVRQMEDFLVGNGNMLEYSIREDGMAPLHNAAAEMENRILLLREQLREEIDRTQSLTADISHQLKTPLAALRLFCEMDEGAHLQEKVSQIERMERLIYALLRLERLCADGYEFVFTEQNVCRIVSEAWDGLKKIYPDRRFRLEGEAVIRCDEKWMREAFVNLLKNACEHTRADGEICVEMETTDAAFYASVEDDGGGVSDRDLPHLFERFYRAAGQKTGGAGIGLAIVREIVWRHHGDIRAENTEKGLKVSVHIPLLKALQTRETA